MASAIKQAHARPKRGPTHWPRPTRPATQPDGKKITGKLGLVWANGMFHASAYRRQRRAAHWSAPTAVNTLEEFAAALDEAVAEMRFTGVEAFLILEHDELAHQVETAPGFSDKAARVYLRNRMRRLDAENEPAVWASQGTVSNREEATHIVHSLPRRFYKSLDEVFHARHLDLTRIVPLIVPLHQSLLAESRSTDEPVLLASRAGTATTFVAGNAKGEILFTRNTMLTWESNPERIAVEVNRSLLYAKQQFGATIKRVLLAGPGSKEATNPVLDKCAGDQTINTLAGDPFEWLDVVNPLPARTAVNLLATHLRRKRKNRFLRTIILVMGWLTLAFVSADAFSRLDAWVDERDRLERLADAEDELRAEHERLETRNENARRAEEFIAAITGETVHPVPEKLLLYFSGILPQEIRLNEFVVGWEEDTASWHFTCDGTIEADAETARATEMALRRKIARGPFKAQLTPLASSAAVMSFSSSEEALHRFSLEGYIRED